MVTLSNNRLMDSRLRGNDGEFGYSQLVFIHRNLDESKKGKT
jgi:hypothetical protein